MDHIDVACSIGMHKADHWFSDIENDVAALFDLVSRPADRNMLVSSQLILAHQFSSPGHASFFTTSSNMFSIQIPTNTICAAIHGTSRRRGHVESYVTDSYALLSLYDRPSAMTCLFHRKRHTKSICRVSFLVGWRTSSTLHSTHSTDRSEHQFHAPHSTFNT
jgi:hypothetical protein